ncbi:MAG: hypothetical protein HY730_08830, partial [Candidatus Tectomicrobia bacterium]|nr:hypothetical protein [Candidatus Tectomicrobia bacterium]
FGLYREAWRYMSIADLIRIYKGLVLSSAAVFIFVNLVFHLDIPSRTIYAIDFFLSFFLIGGIRGSYRFLDYLKKSGNEEGRRVLIYGAGLGGNMALREFIHNQDLHILPIGFIDDDEKKSGVLFNGYPVIGSSENLDWILDHYRITTRNILTQRRKGRKETEVQRRKEEGLMFLALFVFMS